MVNLEKLLCAELKRQLEAKGACTMHVPAGGDLLWGWFLDLNRTRTYHAAGPNPLQPSEIEAYARLMRWPMESRHVAILLAMDNIWIENAARRVAPTPDGVKKLPSVSATPLTAGLLDAMFS